MEFDLKTTLDIAVNCSGFSVKNKKVLIQYWSVFNKKQAK